MKHTTYHSSSVVELLKTVASRADSLADGTEFLKTAIPFLKAETQQIQELRDNERSGYLMQDIMRLLEQMGIPSRNQRVLKAMTTSQLEDYAEDLRLQSKNSSSKHLSVA
jgi:hypothetical protein